VGVCGTLGTWEEVASLENTRLGAISFSEENPVISEFGDDNEELNKYDCRAEEKGGPSSNCGSDFIHDNKEWG
jgi:hypothetical protein